MATNRFAVITMFDKNAQVWIQFMLIMGVIFLKIYVNDLHKVVKNAFLLLFADDSNLFYSGNDMVDITEKINDDLKHLTEWLASNKLSLNVKQVHLFMQEHEKRKPWRVIIPSKYQLKMIYTKC